MEKKYSKRLLLDYKNLISNPTFGEKVNLEEGNLNKMEIILPGPKNSVYESGIFNLSFEFENYPFKCPKVKFKTPIYHPNIETNTGEICMNALEKDWVPTMRISNIIEKIVSLLVFPSLEYPLEFNIAKEYLNDPNEYKIKVEKFIEKYKGMSLQDFNKINENKDKKEEDKIDDPKNEFEDDLIYLAIKESEEESKRVLKEERDFEKAIRISKKEKTMDISEMNEEFDEQYGKCPITLDYMEHPVLCPNGNYYEKKAIIDWIKKKGTDPLTRENLTIDMLMDDEDYRIKIIEYRKKFNK